MYPNYDFPKSENGGTAAILSIAICAIMMCVAFAIEFRGAQNQRAKLQDALDAGVLFAAIAHPASGSVTVTSSDSDVGAESFAAENFRGTCQPKFSIAWDGVDTYAGTASCTVPMPFGGLFGRSTIKVGVTSAARPGAAGNGLGLCLLALNPRAKGVEISGGGAFDLENCIMQVNSTSPTSVNLSGGSSITSAQNCLEGGVQSGESNMTPAPESCGGVPDPFASLPLPPVGACDHTDFSVDSAQTLKPGVYCGGLEAKNETFDFDPGLYIIKDGKFGSSGTATLRGTGVTFFLTGNNSEISWSGGGTYQFTAMQTGLLSDFVIYLDPAANAKRKSHISGGGNTFYNGVIYLPDQQLEISGTGSVSTTKSDLALVADTFKFTGTSTLDIEHVSANGYLRDELSGSDPSAIALVK